MSTRTCIAIFAALSGVWGRALAQTPAPTTPPPLVPEAAGETSADRRASELYEEAVVAEALGKRFVARNLAQQALDASPTGCYAPAITRLLNRVSAGALTGEPAAEPQGSARASRIAYVVSGGLLGLGDGLAFSATVNGVSGSGIAGAGLLGAAVGIGITFLTNGAVRDSSMPTHMWLGALYGLGAAGSIALIDANNLDGTGVAALFATGLAVGAVGGALVGAFSDLTAGDAWAAIALGGHVPFIAVMIELAALTGNNTLNGGETLVGSTMLALGTAGVIAGEFLNTRVHWSAARWGLTLLSGLLGTGVGGLVAALASASPAGLLVLLAVGDALGFGVGLFATQGLANESSNLAVQPEQHAALPFTYRGGLRFTF